jgi:hypothetical protein
VRVFNYLNIKIIRLYNWISGWIWNELFKNYIFFINIVWSFTFTFFNYKREWIPINFETFSFLSFFSTLKKKINSLKFNKNNMRLYLAILLIAIFCICQTQRILKFKSFWFYLNNFFIEKVGLDSQCNKNSDCFSNYCDNTGYCDVKFGGMPKLSSFKCTR